MVNKNEHRVSVGFMGLVFPKLGIHVHKGSKIVGSISLPPLCMETTTSSLRLYGLSAGGLNFRDWGV